MWTLLLVVLATGSPALLQAAPVQGHSGRCSFAGVLHVEGTSRYSLTFQQSLELCQSLDYKLATQEQIIEAYQKGLRTCRYGWIDGQNVTFLPHVNAPNCDSSSTEVTFHPKAAEYLSDVYCFNPSDSSNCEYTVKSNSEGATNGITATESEKPHEDILKEVKTEGFLVYLEEIMGRVKRETSPLDGMEVPRTVLPDVDMKPSTVPTLDTKGPANKPSFESSSSSVAPSVLFPDTEGSGSASEPEPSQFTVRSITIEAAEKKSTQDTLEVQNVASNLNTSSEGQVRILHPISPRKGEGPSTWLIIFAFCVVIGAIVCILAAIATRDKWYGPRQSTNITTEEHNKDYSKTETLPLSEKEQEIVALMSVTALNGKTEDITATCLDEHEKEYLM
ncbi:CD44 antigen [Rhinichthys klamathensis goyatoka]|uniref:CD44 antigen n=1 Tax=Rhinichthys klamathensis goyatoka TaxID=3034132 RepID=UPI0024B4A24B|nr:CD44 antigen [Rhinichthys klamathensis goyatoka]